MRESNTYFQFRNNFEVVFLENKNIKEVLVAFKKHNTNLSGRNIF